MSNSCYIMQVISNEGNNLPNRIVAIKLLMHRYFCVGGLHVAYKHYCAYNLNVDYCILSHPNNLAVIHFSSN